MKNNTSSQASPRSSGRCVPSFCTIEEVPPGAFPPGWCVPDATPEEWDCISSRFQMGFLCMRKYAQKHGGQVDTLAELMNITTTRLQDDVSDRQVLTFKFQNVKKKWTLCPNSVCVIKEDLARQKAIGKWKIIHLPPGGDELKHPNGYENAYLNYFDSRGFIPAVLCPQQTYATKHSSPVRSDKKGSNNFVEASRVIFVFGDHLCNIKWIFREHRESVAEMTEKEKFDSETCLLNVIKRNLIQVRSSHAPEEILTSRKRPRPVFKIQEANIKSIKWV